MQQRKRIIATGSRMRRFTVKLPKQTTEGNAWSDPEIRDLERSTDAILLEEYMDTDVLIVGAGPTGLMLANQLIRRGARTIIIDRNPGPTRETRALGVQARTLEIYSHLGIVDRALELGKRGTGGNIWADGQRRARVAFGETGQKVTPYPFLLVLGQDDNERIMGDKLRDLGGSVQWNTELVNLAQDDGGVTATVKLPDGAKKELRVAWVAGCDGARSSVR